MNLWREISCGEDVPSMINVIVEIPKGSKNKYEIDKESGLIRLDRAMKSAQDYPFDYGFVPQTLWEDGDAPMSCSWRPTHFILVSWSKRDRWAVMHMIDGGEGDDKIVPCQKRSTLGRCEISLM
jgi:inorganic pyrophosphatase